MKFQVIPSALIVVGLFSGCRPPAQQGGPPPGFAVPVKTVVVEPEELVNRIEVVGNLLAGQEVEIAARVDGFVEKIHFEDGQRVLQGDILFELDSGRYAATLDQALARERLALEEFERSEVLRKNRTISQQEFDRAAAALDEARAAVRLARENLNDAKIRAPFDGTMTERRVDVGQFVSRGQVLSSIVDNRQLRVEFRVPERFIAKVRQGSRVQFTTAAFSGETFEGEVFFVSPRVDESTRTLLLRAVAPNPELRLKPGMFVNLLVTTETNPTALFVPESALMYRGETVTVFTVNGENKVEPRRVITGARLPGRVEIIEGLSPGDMVIYEGIQKVGPGSLVNPAVSGPRAAHTSNTGEAGV